MKPCRPAASFSIAVIIAFTGGRPAMISGATGAMALVMIPLVRDHGVEYMFAATILTGIFQFALGALGVGRLMRFIPRTVMVGFVNALAILIFHAQLHRVAHLVEVTSVLDPDGTERVYALTGELFFASTNELVHSFDYDDPAPRVVIDLTDAHVWDSSAVATLDAVVHKFEARGVEVELVGLNDHSHELHNGLTGRLAGSH